MKIAVMSDSHDNWKNLEEVVDMANQKNCEVLLFLGDLIAPPGIKILEKFNGEAKFVWGNNEGERVGITRKMDALGKIELCGNTFEGELGGVKMFMSHFPRISELVAKSGEFDLCLCGHTHKYREEKIGDCLLLNPGAIQGFKTQATFVIFNTSNRKVEKVVLG
jgi:putative phosphoesterase